MCIVVSHSSFYTLGKAEKEIKKLDVISKIKDSIYLLFRNESLARARIIALLGN